jgi:hypothetical protein
VDGVIKGRKISEFTAGVEEHIKNLKYDYICIRKIEIQIFQLIVPWSLPN